MPFTTIFFDLDDTLYPNSSGVWKLIKERMNLYMHQHLGIDWEEIPTLREQYFHEYGTTLRGLQAHYHMDLDEYLSFVHDIPLHKYLQPDKALQNMLQVLPLRKFIFTNADENHARRVLAALGLENCFQTIVDIKAVDPYCKPMQAAFKIALEIAGEPQPKNCILVDDLATNTRAGREFGFYTILFGQIGEHPDANVSLSHLTDLPDLLQDLKY
ncbi:MAG: pyrimidine 5'-nucleotidase [Chloroflexi bacterium GWB2_49_20]|nr:MAG: pyrimidine 5'-nucleotidase [Chloroflexi bacterium GWB2_49_20]OGN80499.1 MAG: pyrimidine 5'-nucleotidase [Chloroflexi bacterium GWC2_49_37]OGN83334.1 MAG: pyrimidine 5'-nucleotidase [Chloroflexi bacterium GWD2_49_16]HCC78178.1 pyrimidine 5'-nucleotidase [Anaerolineae bacterium]